MAYCTLIVPRSRLYLIALDIRVVVLGKGDGNTALLHLRTGQALAFKHDLVQIHRFQRHGHKAGLDFRKIENFVYQLQ